MDATENYGGDGKGLTPMELILVGVAGCIGIDVTMLLGKNLEKIKKLLKQQRIFLGQQFDLAKAEACLKQIPGQQSLDTNQSLHLPQTRMLSKRQYLSIYRYEQRHRQLAADQQEWETRYFLTQ